MTLIEPIVIVEDDLEDQELIAMILTGLKVKHEVKFFDNGKTAFEYLSGKHIVPFIIFSDINMPGMNGFQLRDKIHENDGLRMKCVPYIFLTTGGDSRYIWEAYSKNAQGYFIKPPSLQGWRDFFAMTIQYWEKSKKPSV